MKYIFHITPLDNFEKIFRSDEKIVDTVPDLGNLNIWIYDIQNKIFKQVTKDGGYYSPRVSTDGHQFYKKLKTLVYADKWRE